MSPPVPVHAGIDEGLIASLVAQFYARVRHDDLLGPIFADHVDDWDKHLSRLRDFWSSITLMSGRYKGTPFAVHQRLPGVTAAHFDRWLSLFGETARELAPPDVAEAFIVRAERIAQSLQLGLSRLPRPATAAASEGQRINSDATP